MRRMIRTASVVLVVGVLVASCGGGGGDPVAVRPNTTASTSTTGSPTVFDGFRECTGPQRLLKVTASGTNVLGITWTTDTSLVGETAGYYVQAWPYQIGLRDLPDGEVARFVFDWETNEQTNLDSSYILDGTTAQLIVPFSAIPKLQTAKDWEATITLNGLDLESCTMTATSP